MRSNEKSLQRICGHRGFIGKADLADYNKYLSLQTSPTVQVEAAETTPKTTPKEIAPQKVIMKVFRKYQQREHERMRHPDLNTPDHFFSALAELILED